MKTTAVILAAGIGERLGLSRNKALVIIDKPILNIVLDKFEDNANINYIILVAKKEDFHKIKTLTNGYKKISQIIEGGEIRQQSSYNGVMASESDIVLVHDAARPYITQETINQSIADAVEFGGSVVGVPSKDTVKKVGEDFITETIDRDTIAIIQTPQTFRSEIIKEAHMRAKTDNFTGTDEASLVERLGHKIKLTLGSYQNIKITTKDDLPSKVGIGHDSHRFIDGESLVIGGVRIPFNRSFEANSDGDVVLHALLNALSSSVGGRSISHCADKMCENGEKDSKAYLAVALSLVHQAGYKVHNVSICIEGKQPKLERYVEKMKAVIGRLLEVSVSEIGITATSGEGMTDFGKGLGMQAFAQVSVIQC